MTQSESSFDWQIYADATFAGLAVLIPLPPIDLIMEWYFRRRMLRTIARRNGVMLRPEVAGALERQGCCAGCLMWPLTLTFLILKRLSRKILYFLTIKEAADMLSHYWHQAFLLNYMFSAGHLENEQAAVVAREALDETLKEANTSPLSKVAAQVIGNSRHVWRTLRQIRRKDQEDEMVAESRSMMGEQWEEASGYLETLADRYQARFERLRLNNEIRVNDKEVRPLRYAPLLEGETDDRRQESDPRFKAEEGQAENEAGAGIDSRQSTAATQKEEANERSADDQEAEDSQGE